MDKQFWFYLEHHIYVNIQKNGVLLYNTHSGGKIISKEDCCIQLIKKLYKKYSLGSVKITEEEYHHPILKQFFFEIVSKKMGKIEEISKVPNKPVILLPILSLNRDIKKLRMEGDYHVPYDFSHYLLEANIILNSDCNHNCPQCHAYYKQFYCCSKAHGNEMNGKVLLSILEQLNVFRTHKVNFTGGNIYLYKNLESIKKINWNQGIDLNIYIDYKNYMEDDFIDRQHLNILISAPLDKDVLSTVIKKTKRLSTIYHLVIESQEQYEMMDALLQQECISNYKVHPFYNGNNISFFEENVYLKEEDIFSNTISMREIFRNQKLNAYYFGSLYFLPNGDICANALCKSIGNVNKLKIVDAIHAELISNTAWRQIRKGTTCSTCLYRYLCPPLSNYERAIKHNNLCFVK